jgi:DNA-binding LacI/PurR family transcriptional regulator
VDVFTDFIPSNIPEVYNDVRAIGRVGAEHLLSLGFKHFALCGYWRHG